MCATQGDFCVVCLLVCDVWLWFPFVPVSTRFPARKLWKLLPAAILLGWMGLFAILSRPLNGGPDWCASKGALRPTFGLLDTGNTGLIPLKLLPGMTSTYSVLHLHWSEKCMMTAFLYAYVEQCSDTCPLQVYNCAQWLANWAWGQGLVWYGMLVHYVVHT